MLQAVPLVVDLHSGLYRADVEQEGFWRAVRRSDWRAVLNRRAAFAHLANAEAAELAGLPMNADVVEAMRQRRAEGGRVIVVSEAPWPCGDNLAGAVGCVDEVIGSAPGGAERVRWLSSRFGVGGFDYAGAPVESLVRVARRIMEPVRPSPGPAPYLKALRPHQWVKNLLIFLPMIAAHRGDHETLVLSMIAFAAFSLVASSVYVLNDLLDLPSDRAHPRKRFRPMASGAVPLRHASVMVAACLAAGFALAVFAGPYFLAALGAYTILTAAYSLRLKREPVIDICVLAALYTLRIVAGSAATGIPLSVWLLAFAIFIFLSLAAMKRQAELVDNLQSGREKPAGRGYRIGDLPVVEMMGVCAGYVAVLVLALYLNTPTVASLYASPEFLWAVCAVLLYWISRAILIAHRGEMHDDPIVFAIRDRVSHLCGAAVLMSLAAATWL